MAQGTVYGIPIDSDSTLTADSDFLVPSQRAVKTYVDTNSAPSSHTHAASDTTSGTFADARISESSVLQHVDYYETIALSDEVSDLLTGQAIYSHRVKFTCTIANIVAYVDSANVPTGSTIVLDIKKNGTTIFSTKITIDASESSSSTAATAYALSSSTLTAGDYLTYHIDQVGSTNPGSALKVDWTLQR